MAGLVTNSDAKCYYTKLSSVLFMSHKSARTVMAWLMANIQTHIHFNRWPHDPEPSFYWSCGHYYKEEEKKTSRAKNCPTFSTCTILTWRLHTRTWMTYSTWMIRVCGMHIYHIHDTALLASKHKVQYTGRLQNDILTMTKYLQFRLATCPTKTKTAFILIKLFFRFSSSFLFFPPPPPFSPHTINGELWNGEDRQK